MRKIKVFDTTLRDGEQTPGVALNPEKKLAIAKALSELGVDVIEAGFPMNSEAEFDAVKTIADTVDTKVCALARALAPDLETSMKTGVDVIHTFISTSPQHLKYQMGKTQDEVYEMAIEAVSKVRESGFKCVFSPMDASRTELDYLIRICKGVEAAGADVINIPDTVGVMHPSSMRSMISTIKQEVKVDLDVHCHNDFGLAVANTLAAVEGGASQVQVAVNGLGERAGNADLEQVVLSAELLYGWKTNINKEKIYQTSKLVERLTGVRIMPNFPIVGDNAFAHESGIHVHAVLKNASTFEPISPETVGARRKLVLGKHIGVHGVEAKLKELGIDYDSEQLKEITRKIKELGGKGKRVVEEDLIAIAEDTIGLLPKEERSVRLIDLQIQDSLSKKPSACVRLEVFGQEKEAAAEGVGAVDASLNAIKAAVSNFGKITLDEFHLDAITGGSDALADVTLKISNESQSTLSRGVHENVNLAAVYAFINGLNRLLQK